MKGIVWISLIIFLTGCNGGSQKIAVVDEQKVFNDFLMTKEANKRISQVREGWSKKIDSIGILSTIPGLKADELNRLGMLMQDFRYSMNEQLAQASDKEYSAVWNRINSYSSEYAKKKGYTLMMGKRPEGIWYNESGADVSSDFVNYINDKYNDN